MPLGKFTRGIALALLFALVSAALAHAQSPVDPGKLPERTQFYLLWHGTPSGDSRKTNSIFALWDDPKFAPARDSFVDSVLNQQTAQKTKNTLSREELQQYVTLLDNPFLIGYLRQLRSRPELKTPATKPAVSNWNGLFLIYDRTGKEELLSKAVVRMRSGESEIPKLTEITVAGVPALKVERKTGTTYWAEFGKYAASANELPVFEEILNVLNGKASGSGLAQSAAYQEAKPLLTGGVLEFFLSLAAVDQVAVDSPIGLAAQLKPLVSALKLESIHSVAGRISLDSAKTRLSGAVLGDTTGGGLFDLWGDGQTHPVSMGYLLPGTISYGESQFNLLGIYNTLKRAFTRPGSTQTANPFETMAETRLGMPLPDALSVITGEVAWFQSSPVLDDSQKVYLLGVRDKPKALKLTRTLMGDQISSERTEGNTTFLKVSRGGGQSSAGVAQWSFYYLAVAPTVAFGSSKSATLHQYAALAPANPDPEQFKGLLAARAQFPETLNGFSYFDFGKVDWPGLRARWIAEVHKAAETAKSTDKTKQQQQFADWLSQVDPQVFSQHLHSMSGASWKDAKGVHFEEWLD